jgi:hypothetical protein
MAQLSQAKVIDGGLNSDFENELVPSGDYLDAKNIRARGGVKNIVGNAEIPLKDLDGVTGFILNSNYVVVGSVKNTLRDSIIYLIANTSGNHLLTEYTQSDNIHKIIIKCGTNAESNALNLSTSVQCHNPRIINRADTAEEGDLLFWLDKDGVPRKINIRKVKNGGYGVNILADFTTVVKKPPMYAPSNVNLVRVPNGNLTIQNKMYQFAYRYIYDDYEKSVFSPISNSLVPYYIFNETNILPTDNNIAYNAVQFTIQSGATNAQSIEIIYREYFDGIWSNFYTIDTIASNGSDINYTFTGTGQKIPLDNSEAPDVLQFDYVPLSAKAQEVVNGNVVVYGNFKEGYDKTAISATVGTTVSNYIGDNKMFFNSGLNPASNMMLNPGGKYKIAVVYFDEYGRNAGAFTSNDMVINVPHIHWNPALLAAGTGTNWWNTRQTYLPNITINSPAPSWAKYFRLAITEDSNYESEIVTDILDFQYSSLALSGDTCSLTNLTFLPQANLGPANDIPFFKPYGTNQLLKVTYSNCDTDAAATTYYNTSSSPQSITYRNKLISDPARMIYEYKKAVVATSGTDFTVTEVTPPSGGRVNVQTNLISGIINQSQPNVISIQWYYYGGSPIVNPTIDVYYTGFIYGNSRLPADPSAYVSFTYTGTINYGDLIATDIRSVDLGDYIDNAIVHAATADGTPSDGTVTVTNNTSDIMYVLVNNTGSATLINAGASVNITVPFGYTITAYKYQTVTGSTTDSYVTVSVVNPSVLPSNDSTSPKQLSLRMSNLGYTFQSGDEISFIYDYYKNKQANNTYNGLGLNEKVFKIIDLVTDPNFYKSDGTTIQLDGNWIQLEESAKAFIQASGDTSGATQIVGLKAKILRQKKISSTGSQGDVFYEIPQTYLVSSYTPGTKLEMTTAGDCMFKSDYVILDGSSTTPIGGKTDSVQRVFYSSIPTKNYLIEGDSASPLFLTKVNKNGRPAVEDKQARQREFPSTVRWSQNLEFNSNVNGLNRFLYLDFKDLDGSFGPIKRLAIRDRMMRCYQEDKVGVLPVYQSIITNASGGTDLTLSTELFNNVQYYAGNYSIGNATGSLVSDSYADYFIDDIRKVICRLGQEGITPISITTQINKWAGENIMDNAMYVAGYDSDNRIVVFSSQKGTNKYTISFSERTERFESFYTYYPYTFNSLNNRLYTSDKSGSVWEHSSASPYCNFYGIQYDAKIKVLFNENPMMKKIFMTLTEVSNSMWVAEYVKGAANINDSSIPYNFFRQQEGFFNAPFLRDSGAATPTTGKPIRGNWCILELKALTPANYVTLLMLKYGYNESKIN